MQDSSLHRFAFVSAALLLANGYASDSVATPQDVPVQNNDLGLSANPNCGLGRDFKNALKSFGREISFGEKAQTEKWELELFRNPETKTWAVLGKSLDKSHPSYYLCLMANGKGDHTTQKWYQELFAKKPR
jgi:hypothetical protein